MRCPATIPRAKNFSSNNSSYKNNFRAELKPTIAPHTVSHAGMIIHMVEMDTITIRGTQIMALAAELSFCVALPEQEKQH